MVVAVTGANGFVGSDLVREFSVAGVEVVALARAPIPALPKVGYRRYDLSGSLDRTVLAGVDAVVHCAFVRYDAHRRDAFDVNVRGTMELFELAATHRARFIFISSLSAVPHAESRYGKHKLLLEQLLLGRGATVVRPGLVVGDGGIVRALYETMRGVHVMLLIDGGGQPVQCVGLRDLSAVLRAIVQSGKQGESVTVASGAPISVRSLALDVRRKFKLTAVAIHLPLSLVYPAVAGAEWLGVPTPVTTENLLGLQAATVQPVTDTEASLGVPLKPWSELLDELEFANR